METIKSFFSNLSRPALPRWAALPGWIKGGIIAKVAIALAVLMAAYYPVGMAMIHAVDDDPDFGLSDTGGPAVAEGESRAVAVAAALIDREVNTHRWTANDPFFMPGAALDNMPHYQQGIIYALSRFAIEMSDQIGRSRGSSQVDRDLDKAAGLLKYSGTVWTFDFTTSLMPTAASDVQYRAARKALLAYNKRLAAGDAVFEARADNLQGTLERISSDLGSVSASLDAHVSEHAGGWVDFRADDVFYSTKGRIYAYYLVLRELGLDYANVIADKELGAVWGQMLTSFKAAAAIQPWVIVNGNPDAQIAPSHLAAQGFYLLRARTQLKEVANILLK